MSIIYSHNEFVRAVKGFLDQEQQWDLIDQIEHDCRDAMTEPDHYGLQAIKLAENWLDSQSGFNVMVKKPDRSSAVMLPCREVEGRLEYLLGEKSSFPLDDSWQLIAVQKS